MKFSAFKSIFAKAATAAPGPAKDAKQANTHSILTRGIVDAQNVLQILAGSEAAAENLTAGQRTDTLSAYAHFVGVIKTQLAGRDAVKGAAPSAVLDAKFGKQWRGLFTLDLQNHPTFAQATLANALLVGIPALEAAMPAPAVESSTSSPKPAPSSAAAPAPAISRDVAALAAANAQFSARMRASHAAEPAPAAQPVVETLTGRDRMAAAFAKDAAKIAAEQRAARLN
jgi:hypothetical protein